MSTLDNVPGFHEAPDPFGPTGVAKNVDTGEIEHADFDAHERGEALLPMCTVTAIAEGITGIEPAGEAERAAAAKSEALVPWAQGVARHKVEKFPREDKRMHELPMRCCRERASTKSVDRRQAMVSRDEMAAYSGSDSL